MEKRSTETLYCVRLFVRIIFEIIITCIIKDWHFFSSFFENDG